MFGLDLRRRKALIRNQLAYDGWRLTPGGRRSNRVIRELKNKYAGRRCFIMGNGPSLLSCDLNALSSEITIVSNAHFLIWDKLNYTPTFLTVEDRLVAEDRAKELRALRGIQKIFPFDLRHLLRDDGDETAYVNFIRNHRPFPGFSDDLALRAFWGGTVSFFNLQLAAHLGCTKIILIGFDHNYKVPENKSGELIITSDELDVNHIHPDYFGPGYRWHDPNVARMEIGYLYARQSLAAKGVEVLNATVGGHLEVFPRIEYASLF
jgi:hypothetical protein